MRTAEQGISAIGISWHAVCQVFLFGYVQILLKNTAKGLAAFLPSTVLHIAFYSFSGIFSTSTLVSVIFFLLHVHHFLCQIGSEFLHEREHALAVFLGKFFHPGFGDRNIGFDI